jgi:outer membrane protein assembly factor BamB
MTNRRAPESCLASLVAALTFLVVGAAHDLGAQDWPQWRGPARDGQALGLLPPKTWPKELRRAWRVTVGEGHASPIVAHGRVFTLTRKGEDEVVSAVDLATGKAAWERRYAAPYTMNSAATGHGKGPKSTPLVADGRVFTLGISGILTCLEAATGRIVWQKEFARQYKTTSPLYGAATSPILEGGLLIVYVGGHDDGALTAFDPATGAVRWTLKGEGPGYASPVVAEFSGVRQVVTLSQTRLVGVDPVKGSLLWAVPFTTDYDQNAVTPLVIGDLVLYSGVDKPLRAVRPTRKGSAWEAAPAWEAADVALYMSSPIAVGARVVGFSQRKKGQIVAIDPRSGRVIWASEGRQGDNAALVALGESALALTDAGVLTVFDPAARGYVPTATYSVAESATWAHPVPVGSGLLVKDADGLTLFRLE